jgi:FkbM family methyltransferase
MIDQIQRLGCQPPSFCLVDVGVSGGIYEDWRRWGGSLKGLGVDAITEEVERLQREESLSQFKYVAARVSHPNTQPVAHSRTTYALHRTSAYLGATLLLQLGKKKALSSGFVDRCRAWLPAMISGHALEFAKVRDEAIKGSSVPVEANYSNVTDPREDPFYRFYQDRFSRHAPSTTVASRTADLDTLVSEAGLSTVDFLKIDTDGFELDVLLGANQTLATTIGVEVEVQFQGPVHDQANVFCNIDRKLREQGFFLARLEPWSYGRSALPRQFKYQIPAQTVGGPLAWGDALYLREPSGLKSEQAFVELRPEVFKQKLQVLALICDMYDLEDLAAEAILESPQLFEVDNHTMLDFLAAKLFGDGTSYASLVAAFAKNPLALDTTTV